MGRPVVPDEPVADYEWVALRIESKMECHNRSIAFRETGGFQGQRIEVHASHTFFGVSSNDVGLLLEVRPSATPPGSGKNCYLQHALHLLSSTSLSDADERLSRSVQFAATPREFTFHPSVYIRELYLTPEDAGH